LPIMWIMLPAGRSGILRCRPENPHRNTTVLRCLGVGGGRHLRRSALLGPDVRRSGLVRSRRAHSQPQRPDRAVGWSRLRVESRAARCTTSSMVSSGSAASGAARSSAQRGTSEGSACRGEFIEAGELRRHPGHSANRRCPRSNSSESTWPHPSAHRFRCVKRHYDE